MSMRAVGLVAIAVVATAEAHHSASQTGALFVERYLVCDEPSAIDRVECVGPHVARAAMLKALALGELVRGKNLDSWIDPAHKAAVWAAYFHVREAVMPLRAWLDIRLAKGDRGDHLLFDKLGLRAEAAFALARLGDAASAPAIAALVRDLETDGYGSTWADSLDALAELDPARASTYAIEFLARQTDFRTSMPGGSSKLLALDLIRAGDADRAKPVLAKLAAREEHGDDHAYCELMATRVRLDPAVHAQVRELFETSYGGTWLAGCAESVMKRYGDDPADAATLVRHLGRDDAGMDFGMANLAYARILELELALAGRRDKAAEQARDVLRRGLVERSSWPHVADPKHANYSLHFVAYHAAALAGLGDAAAGKRLEALIGDAGDHSGAAWLAALYDLRFTRAGAVDRAAALMARGTHYTNATTSGFVFAHIRERVLDAFVARAPDDPRWTVMLLDAGDVEEHALDLLARRPPPGACDAVTAAATGTTQRAAEFAFLALTVEGTACIPALEAVVAKRDAPAEIRGAAIEVLAAVDAPKRCSDLHMLRADHVTDPAVARAEHVRSCTVR